MEKPYYIALTGVIIVVLLSALPIKDGYELALAYVPGFFLILGFLLAFIYWALIKLLKKRMKFIFYLFFLGNLIWGVFIAIDMAYNVFNF